jgi:hypothetical protein
MFDHVKMLIPKAIDELTPELKKFLNETRSKLDEIVKSHEIISFWNNYKK